MANRQILEEMDDPVELIKSMSQALEKMDDDVEVVVSNKRSRGPPYCEEEDIGLCHAFQKVSLIPRLARMNQGIRFGVG